MCGEHMTSEITALGITGSSPHVRGALWRVRSVVLFKGIIPACAGSTARFSTVSGLTGDHPRMCGEH